MDWAPESMLFLDLLPVAPVPIVALLLAADSCHSFTHELL